MEPKDRKRLAACLLGASELYGRETSEAVTRIWERALAAYDIAAVESAFSRHFVSPDSGQFMPKPADIVKMLEGSSEDSAMVAWAKVDRGFRSVGPYQSVVFDDPLIHRVLHDMGGWMGLATKKDDEWPFIANEFVKRYRGFRARREQPDYPKHLIGLSEAHNRSAGHDTAEPVLIGNPDRARLVRDGGGESHLLGVQRPVLAALRLLPAKGHG